MLGAALARLGTRPAGVNGVRTLFVPGKPAPGAVAEAGVHVILVSRGRNDPWRSRRFLRTPRDGVQEVLNALVALGLARRLDDDRYAP